MVWVGEKSLIPFRTQFRGPLPTNYTATDMDIIDEALYYFKANVFFRTYEVKVCFLINCKYLKAILFVINNAIDFLE